MRQLASFLGSLALAGAVALTGCDGSDPVARAIDDATIELRKLNPAGGPAPIAEVRTNLYNAALTRLRTAGAGATQSQQAAVALLTAEAEAGLAQIALDEALDAERRLQGDLQRARATFAQWQNHKIREGAARQYDPAAELAEIDQAISERDAQIDAAEVAKATIDDQIADLQAQVDGWLSQAGQERLVESDLRERSRSTTAVEGATLIQSAREHQRIADALEVEAEKIQMRIDQAGRQAEEARLEVDRLRAQRELLGKARADVQQRAQVSAEQAAQAAQDAEQSAQRLADTLASIADGRSDAGDLAGAYGRAFDSLSKALSAATKAQSYDAARNNARAVIATLQQSIGDARAARARGCENYVNFLQTIAAPGDQLPGSAANAARLTDARAQLQAERQAAAEAYGAAREAFTSIRVQGDDVRARIEQLDAKLGELAPPAEGG